MHRRRAAAALPLLAATLARGQAEAPAPAPVSFHPAFAALPQAISSQYPDVHSVVVLRHGRLLFEHYAAGGPQDLRVVQSVTKSVLSLAVGAALGRGVLASLDTPVAPLLGLAEAGTQPPLTLRHLLTMTAGFQPQARWSPGQADDAAYLLNRPRVAAPGAVFSYDNLAANLLALAMDAALQAAAGLSLQRFVEQALWAPLGIGAYGWDKGPHGHALGFSGLRLRTADMARLGQLALDAGTWAGQALLPEAYARAMRVAHNAGGPPVGLAYGYLWWVVPGAAPQPTCLASGWGGQCIWLHPPLGLVVATTATVSEAANARGQAVRLIRNEVFRAASATP